jgi:replicative DNA helicase
MTEQPQPYVLNTLYNAELELSIFACAMLNPETWYEMAVNPNDFYLDKHRMIARAIDKIFSSGRGLDEMTLVAELTNQRHYDEIGGFAYITKIIGTPVMTLLGPQYAEELKSLAQRRAVLAAANKIAQVAYDTKTDITDMVSRSRDTLDEALNNGPVKTGQSVTEVARLVDAAIESRRGQKNVLLGYDTGYSDLNKYLRGLRPGKLYYIAARPGKGKTAMLINLALSAAIDAARAGAKVAFFSREMDAEQIVIRLVGIITGINTELIETGAFTPDEWESYYAAIEKVAALNIQVYGPSECRTIEMVETICRQLVSRGELDIVFADYVQIFGVRLENTRSNREQEVAAISARFNNIKGFGVPVVAAAQLNRGVETRAEGRPQLSDLRESGALENDADVVIFLWNPDPTNEPNVLEAVIAKNRGGRVGMVNFVFHKESQRMLLAERRTVKLEER